MLVAWRRFAAGRVHLTLGKGLLAAGSLGEKLLALGDGLATETDTLLRVEDGTFPDKGLDATGTAIDLVEGDLVNNLGTVLTVYTSQSWIVLSDIAERANRVNGLLLTREGS